MRFLAHPRHHSGGNQHGNRSEPKACLNATGQASHHAQQQRANAIAQITPDQKKLVFEKTISFLPYETGWPPSYKYDCLPDPPQFKNRFAWNGSGSPLATPPMPQREERAEDCHPSDVEATFEEEDAELKRQVERNRWGR